MTMGWTGIAVALAVLIPAGLVCTLSRRRLAAAMLAWLVSPVFVYAALVAWEMLTRPPVANPIGTALYGFMLISPLVTLPWLLVCLVGCGLGLGLRRLVRRPRALVAAPTLPAAPALPGWRHAHIGFENDAVTIGGLDVWKHEWRRAAGPIVKQPHPSYPTQAHDYEIFEIGTASSPVRFAAGELSNGVWGFSVPAGHQAAAGAVKPPATAWRAMVLIAGGAAVAIAGLSFLSTWSGGARQSPPAPLAVVPSIK